MGRLTEDDEYMSFDGFEEALADKHRIDAILDLPAIDVSIPLRAIYRRVLAS